MDCISRNRIYDCFHLTRSNAEEFVEWIKKHYNVCKHNINENYVTVNVMLHDDNNENYIEFNRYEYETWYVWKDNNLYTYSDREFCKYYFLRYYTDYFENFVPDMKCRYKTEYDCFYLYKNNVDKFIEWFKKHVTFFNYKYFKPCEDEDGYLYAATRDPDSIDSNNDDNSFEENRFYYNLWYVVHNKSLHHYSDGEFRIHFNVVDKNEIIN